MLSKMVPGLLALALTGCVGSGLMDKNKSPTALNALPTLFRNTKLKIQIGRGVPLIVGVDFAIVAPNRVRVEVPGPLTPFMQATLSAERYTLLQNDQYVTGLASACAVEKILHVRLPAKDLIRALLGQVPRISTVQKSMISGPIENLTEKIRGTGGQIETITIDTAAGSTVAELRDADGNFVWRITQIGAAPIRFGTITQLQTKTIFEQPDRRVEIRWKENDVRTGDPQALFVIKRPSTLAALTLRCSP